MSEELVILPKNSKTTRSMGSRLILTLCCLGYSALAALFLWSSFFAVADNRLVPSTIAVEQGIDYLKQIPREQLLSMQAQERNILVSNPTDLSAIKNLLLLADLLGDKEQSAKLSLIAANRSIHDFPSQAVALQVLLAEKDYSGALYHIDGLLRSDPERRDQMMVLLKSLAESRDALPSLVNLLKTSPPWRSEFIAYLEQNSTQVDVSYGLLSALRSKSSAISAIEVRPLIAKLVAEKNFESASYIWLDFLTETELRKVSLLYDGGFDFDIGNRFFDWTFQPLQNVDLRLVPKTTGSVDRILRVSFSSGKTPFNNFFQLLRLSPGNYVLRGEEKTENLDTNSGLVWHVTCVSSEPKIVATTVPLLNAAAWVTFESAFTVPTEGCDAQEIRLANNARAYLDTQISGVVYFDNLSVQSVEGLAGQAQ